MDTARPRPALPSAAGIFALMLLLALPGFSDAAISRQEAGDLMTLAGVARQKGMTEVYRGHEFTVNLLRKVQLQIAVNDEFVEPTINAILKGGRSGEKGEIGDGKIFVVPLEDCIRIRTGERGTEAI